VVDGGVGFVVTVDVVGVVVDDGGVVFTVDGTEVVGCVVVVTGEVSLFVVVVADVMVVVDVVVVLVVGCGVVCGVVGFREVDDIIRVVVDSFGVVVDFSVVVEAVVSGVVDVVGIDVEVVAAVVG